MDAAQLQTPAGSASAYLQQLQELASEIGIAMQAIASNSLSSLEESVAKQEMICAGLKVLAKGLGDELRTPAPSLHSDDDAVAHKVRSATLAVRDLNLEYASLLKHSGRSIALLSSLCKSHTGQFPERGAQVKRQTWSCEM